MIKPDALYDLLYEEGWQPDLVEEDTEIIICCPLCDDDRPRLYVSTEHGGWTCFHCHEQGGLLALLTEVLELDVQDAMDTLTSITTRDPDAEYEDYFEHREHPEKKKLPDVTLKLPVQFEPINANAPSLFLRYLNSRRISPELAESRGFGYCLTGRFSHRLIIPLQSDGHLYSFIGRTVLTQCPNCTERIDDCSCRPYKFPKVLYPKKEEGSKPSLTLFNIDHVRASRSHRIIVNEGWADAMRRPNEAVALNGSSISATQVSLLAGISRDRDVVIALDGDKAGYAGALKVAEALTSELVKTRVALLPKGSDPGSLSDEAYDQALKRARAFIL